MYSGNGRYQNHFGIPIAQCDSCTADFICNGVSAAASLQTGYRSPRNESHILESASNGAMQTECPYHSLFALPQGAERLDCCFAMHPFVTTFPGSACPVCRQNPIRSVYAAAAEVVPASDIGVVPVIIIGKQFGEDSLSGTSDFHSGNKPIAPERCITELIVQLQAVPESIKG